jgi:5'-deoxynucleotidase YfbR-like HD superfamily hydrolase
MPTQISGDDVRLYAQYIAGHRDAPTDGPPLAAARAVLTALASHGRLTPPPHHDPVDANLASIMLNTRYDRTQAGTWTDEEEAWLRRWVAREEARPADDFDELIAQVERRANPEADPLLDASISLGALALRLGRADRSSLHPDGETFESVTDHTVAVGLLACAWAAQLQPDLNLGLIAQFTLLHDLVEAYATDTNTLRLLTPEQLADKKAREQVAYDRIRRELGIDLPWIHLTIARYESLDTREARWVKAVDKAAVKITHILNNCAAPIRDRMTVAELTARYNTQYDEVFGPTGYARDFPTLANLYRQLVDQELEALTAALEHAPQLTTEPATSTP